MLPLKERNKTSLIPKLGMSRAHFFARPKSTILTVLRPCARTFPRDNYKEGTAK